MTNDSMTCDQCGGTMKKINSTTMQCDGCGATMKIKEGSEGSGDDTSMK